MSLEAISKLQPGRTIALRGSDGFGAHASLCNVTANSFNVYGVFRDQDDFTVLILYDADNQYEHYSIKYLPAFDFTGIVLNFSVQYNGVQSVDSNKFSWIDWSYLDVTLSTGQPLNIPLFDNMMLSASTSTGFKPATGTFTFTVSGGFSTIFDRLTLFVNNVPFDWISDASGTYTVDDVANFFAVSINGWDWSSFASSSIAVTATFVSGGILNIMYGRTGRVNTSGLDVTWISNPNTSLPPGTKFTGLHAGDIIWLNNGSSSTPFTVATVTSPTALTLTASAGTQSNVGYLAPYGGIDGNGLTVYMVVRPGNNLAVSPAILPLTGGTSYDAVWDVSLDLSAYSATSIRQMWFTFAPALTLGAAYVDTEWSVAFTNWSITDPGSKAPLKCAGQNSVRVHSYDTQWVTYLGTGWTPQLGNNNVFLGRAKSTANPGDSVTVKYYCDAAHDLYLGTMLYVDRGIVSVSLDGGSPTSIDCFVNSASTIPARRLVTTGVALGQHSVVITLSSSIHTSGGLGSWDISSSGHNFWFDFIEAAVPTDIPTLVQPYTNVSPALDYDTDQTYKPSPARTMWGLQKLGFTGDLNLYLGVFWWFQRKRGTNAGFNHLDITFSGTFVMGESATVSFGTTLLFSIAKTITTWDTNLTIAQHFAYYINCASVEMYATAAASGPDGVLTIHPRTPAYSDTVTASTTSSAGTVSPSAATLIPVGQIGDWVVDYTAANLVNYPTRQFLADLYAECATAGIQCTTAFSMELVNPPDEPNTPFGSPGVWSARFADASNVETDTGFSSLTSTQCAPVSALTTFQKNAFTTIAGLQNAAGLTPWLQFGEFLWWFFAKNQNVQLVPISQFIGFVAFTTPISIGLPTDHNLSTGDTVTISNVGGMTSANGTWFVTVTNSTHFTLNGSSPNAAWDGLGTGLATYSGFIFSTTPIEIKTVRPHGSSTGDRVIVSGVQGMTSANGTWVVTVIDATHFTLNGSAPNGDWVPWTGLVSGGGMAYYDTETTGAATTALSRSLFSFTCQDDDPTVNSSVDANFLAARLKLHCDTISAFVLTSYPLAKFELLFPNDVNNSVCQFTAAVPFPQGGRLNGAVNFPVAWGVPATSGLDRIKVECLSWGAQYRNLDLAKQAMTLFTTAPNTWTPAQLAYLVPWFNNGCPWTSEFLAAIGSQVSQVFLWAMDHLSLMSWPMPLPKPGNRAGSTS